MHDEAFGAVAGVFRDVGAGGDGQVGDDDLHAGDGFEVGAAELGAGDRGLRGEGGGEAGEGGCEGEGADHGAIPGECAYGERSMRGGGRQRVWGVSGVSVFLGDRFGLLPGHRTTAPQGVRFSPARGRAMS